MSMELFASKRRELGECYDRLASVAGELGDASARQLAEEAKREMSDESFSLVVVGEFSRGKSTFVNALLGERILPSKSTPTTAIISKIQYGAEKAFALHYRGSERVSRLTAEDFKDLTVKEGVNYGEIAYAELRYPLEICKSGITVIDTPGTNDADEMREQITYTFIPSADAAIFVLSAAQLCSQSEMDFLRDRIMGNDITKIFFAVNHKDEMENAEAERRVLNEARKLLGAVVPNPRVFMVSAKQALDFRRRARGETVKSKVPPASNLAETGFEPLEGELERYLLNERMGAKMGKYVSRLRHRCGGISRQIALQENSIGVGTAELAQRVEATREEFRRVERECAKILSQAKSELESLADELASEYGKHLRDNYQNVNLALDCYDGSLDAKELSRYLESKIAPLQTATQTTMRSKVRDSLARSFDAVSGRLQKAINSNSQQRALALLTDDADKTPVDVDFEIGPISLAESDNLKIGMVIGALALVTHAPLLAFGALFFGDSIQAAYQGHKRSEFIGKARLAVRQRYEGNIPRQIEEFRSNLNRQTAQYMADIEATIRDNRDALERQMQQLLDERRNSAQTDETKRRHLQKLREALAEVSRRTKALE